MAKNEKRKQFLRNAGILGLAGLFGVVKLGNMSNVKAAVNDNSSVRDISEDIIYCDLAQNEVATKEEIFAVGQTSTEKLAIFGAGQNAADLADAVNNIHKKFLVKKSLWVD